jgi:hypothetical protein
VIQEKAQMVNITVRTAERNNLLNAMIAEKLDILMTWKKMNMVITTAKIV